MPIIDSIANTEASEEILKMCRAGAGFSMLGSFAAFLRPYTRDTMRRAGVPNADTCAIPFSDKAYDKKYKLMCSTKVTSLVPPPFFSLSIHLHRTIKYK